MKKKNETKTGDLWPKTTAPTVVYEDSDVIVFNKPAGLLVHATASSKESTLADFVYEKFPEIREVGEPMTLPGGKTLFRPGIVHRLDRETSGVLLVARNQKSFLSLKGQFQEHSIKKTYYAIVHGSPEKKIGTINLPIGRSGGDWRRRSTLESSRGKIREAVTEYKMLFENESYSFLEAYPQTGRTHQIRVHLKAIGHPVLCDALYAEKRPCPKDLGRLALHALSLEFKALNGEMLRVEAPLPEDMQRFAQGQFEGLRNL